MPGATRLGDKNTGHDICMPTELITGSLNVFINGKNAGRQFDKYSSHSCIDHDTHQDFINTGSDSVFINGLPAARIGDRVNPTGQVQEGSNNVFIG